MRYVLRNLSCKHQGKKTNDIAINHNQEKALATKLSASTSAYYIIKPGTKEAKQTPITLNLFTFISEHRLESRGLHPKHAPSTTYPLHSSSSKERSSRP